MIKMSRIARSFFGLSLPRTADWPESGDELQRLLVDEVLESDIFRTCPPSPGFQLQFWKRVVARLETSSDLEEVNERIYDLYTSLLASGGSISQHVSGPPTPSYVTHFWNSSKSGPPVSTTLLEARTTAQDGTTGLRTWGASLFLCQYLQARPELVQRRSVLELGCGAGLLGLVVAKLGAHEVTLTDCRVDVLERCTSNVSLPSNAIPDGRVRTALLDWTEAEDGQGDDNIVVRQAQECNAQIVLGSDIVYAIEIIKPLVQTLKVFLEHAHQLEQILIALTLRREETFEKFIAELTALSIEFTVEDVVAERGGDFFLTANNIDATSVFRLVKIKRRPQK